MSQQDYEVFVWERMVAGETPMEVEQRVAGALVQALKGEWRHTVFGWVQDYVCAGCGRSRSESGYAVCELEGHIEQSPILRRDFERQAQAGGSGA